MSKELTITETELPVVAVREQVNKIQELMKSVMKEDVHYGVIPGTPKPTLYKAGAEKLGFVFRMAPRFEITKTILENGHREYEIVGTLRHIETGAELAQGVGMCSTMESKYRWRESKKKCPRCGAEAIRRNKDQPGWYCWAKKGGCGAQFPGDVPAIEKQKTGKVENPDIADVYNTVLKVAKKRCYVDMTITACAASDVLTQDIEDLSPENNGGNGPRNITPKEKGKEKTEQKNGGQQVLGRQKIIDKIVAILKNDKFDDKDRVGVKTEIKMAKSNIALGALRAIWQIELNKRLDDFVDDIPGEAPKEETGETLTDEQMADLEKTANQGWFTDEEKAAKEVAEKKQAELDIY